MPDRFATAAHTIVVSDLHVTDAQPREAHRPLWKRYKQRDLFIDGSFARFLEFLRGEVDPDAELVLNGDVFDFDSVMAIPDDPPFPVSWLERQRGLEAEASKSRFKFRRILDDHPVFIQALRDWILAGHRAVLVIGNHDIELHWPGVQADLRAALDLPPEHAGAFRVCEWFYISNGDTHIEHGNQFDSYCLCADPVHPTTLWRGVERVRVPFGNLAERYMLNGMGLFNPHVESSFIMSLRQYARFFLKYMARIQPGLAWTWFWGAVVTLVVTLREGFLPALRDPLSLEARVEGIAARGNATPGMVWALRSLHVHPAVFSPWKIVRELWLDRAALLALVVYASFQFITVYNVFSPISPWWAGVVFLLLLPPFAFYARGVVSDVDSTELVLRDRLPIAVQVARAGRVVIGHTHREHHTLLEHCELINTGTWSPAYRDVECTVPFGRKCFAWVRPGDAGRTAALFEWNDPGITRVEPEHDAPPPRLRGIKDAARRARRALGLATEVATGRSAVPPA